MKRSRTAFIWPNRTWDWNFQNFYVLHLTSEITRSAREGCKNIMLLPAPASRYGVVSRDFSRHVLYYHCFGGPRNSVSPFADAPRAHIHFISFGGVDHRLWYDTRNDNPNAASARPSAVLRDPDVEFPWRALTPCLYHRPSVPHAITARR